MHWGRDPVLRLQKVPAQYQHSPGRPGRRRTRWRIRVCVNPVSDRQAGGTIRAQSEHILHRYDLQNARDC